MKRLFALMVPPLFLLLASCAGTPASPEADRERITGEEAILRKFSDPARPVSRDEFLRTFGE